MAIAQKLSINDFTNYIKLLGEWAEKEKLTVIAKDKLANEVVGVVIAGDLPRSLLLTQKTAQLLVTSLSQL